MVLSGEYESRLAAPLPSDDDVNRATGSTSYLNDQHLVLAARSGCRSGPSSPMNRSHQGVIKIPASVLVFKEGYVKYDETSSSNLSNSGSCTCHKHRP